MRKLVLVDASGYIYRAFYALPPLKNPKGVPVGGLYGFCSMMIKILEDYKNDYILVVFDSSRDSFRKELYPEYKANRSQTPPDLIPQFDLVRQACDVLGVARTEHDGYEADDLIASYASQMGEGVSEVVILSSDKDLMQLVTPSVYMMDPIKQKKIDEKSVVEKFGVMPEKVIDVQALIGDSSDNIPGAPGIGPKTAAELILQFGTLDNLLSSIDQIKQPSRKKSLSENVDLIHLSKQLVTLRCDLVLEKKLDDLHVLQNDQKSDMGLFFAQHGFKTLLSRFSFEEKKSEKTDYKLIQTESDLEDFIKECEKYEFIAVDTETTGLDVMSARLVGISISHTSNSGVYIPISHQGLGVKQLSLEFVREKLRSLFENEKIAKIGHNIKYDLSILTRHGFALKNIQDTMVMSYVLDSAGHGHGMDELARLHFNCEPIPYKEVTSLGKKQVTFDYVDLESACRYAAEDADITLRLYHLFKDEIKNNSIYQNMDLPLIEVLFQMEQTGVMVDGKYLEQLGDEFSKLMMELESKIHQESGVVFNIASPKQLGDVLYGKLQLEPTKKLKTGQYSTNSDVLEDLVGQGVTLAQLVLDWRQLAKLKGTYTDGLIASINPQTNRVHTSFSQTITSTGRLASSEPNLQNIPVRTLEGKKIRKAFIAPEDCKLISFDYSQIELRILAHMADVDALKKSFQGGIDIHTQTASRMFNVSIENVTPDLRRQAKAINFGIIYGMSAFGLSQSLKVPQSQAKEYIDLYFSQFPEIAAYMEKTKEFASQNGHVLTLDNRKCVIPGIQDKNGNVRAFAQRQAINAPIQGTNADMIKKAMIAIQAFLKNQNLKTKMVLQVHDELLFEVPQNEIDIVIPQIQKLMEETNLCIPTPVNFKVGDNWEQIHD